jgi:hypothetical protein
LPHAQSCFFEICRHPTKYVTFWRPPPSIAAAATGSENKSGVPDKAFSIFLSTTFLISLKMSRCINVRRVCCHELWTPNELIVSSLGRDYTSDFVRDFMCDLLHIADAIRCICHLVYDTDLLPITHSMRFCVRFAVQFGACDLVHARFLRNCKTDTESQTKSHLRFGAKKDRKGFLSDTKSQMHRIASAICSISRMKSHTKWLV